ncbi:MAG: Hypothetical protein AJITA_00780 [Acetilactobacillus jinshanensis]
MSWLAEVLPEYQHEDASQLGENIRKCLDTNAQRFVIMFKSGGQRQRIAIARAIE